MDDVQDRQVPVEGDCHEKKICMLVLLVILTAMTAGNTVAAPAEEITVSAAISLKNAFEELGRLCRQENGNIKISFNFGASGDLTAQIRGGAPVDVFASAAQKDMDELGDAGFIQKNTKTNFVSNSVVLVVPASSKISIASFEDLKNLEIRKIAVGNPKTVPAGRYADETLKYFKISGAIQDKLVLGENVRQVLDYVARGEVDAGVVYSTDAMVRQQDVKIIMTAPAASHKPIVYPIAVVRGTKNENAAKKFIAFVVSSEGRKILSKYGFAPIAPAK